MKHEQGIKDFNHALINNFRLKAKILLVLFCFVFAFQLTAFTWFATQTDFLGRLIPYRAILLGPFLILLAISSELLMVRYLRKIQGKEEQLKKTLVYVVTFMEVSFPSVLLFVIGSILTSSAVFTPIQALNLPFYAITFIMIILSSLLLDFRLCLFGGITGGLEFFLISIYFIHGLSSTQDTDYINIIAKSVIIIMAGLLSGLVSKKTREAVLDALEAKNELIHRLDMKVAEKTKEVMAQKAEIENKNVLLEEKQKEIIDSIHYAKRIQNSLLTSEKYIRKHLKK